MKSQFDPDVWAALLMIMVIGFGGLIFLQMFVNSFVMHGILQIFDQELDQRCTYFLLPIAANDYYFSTESGSNFNELEGYYIINPPERESYFDEFMSIANKSIKGVDIGGNATVKGLCWGIGSYEYVGKKIKNCEKSISEKGVIVLLECSVPVYGPTDVGEARVVFVG